MLVIADSAIGFYCNGLSKGKRLQDTWFQLIKNALYSFFDFIIQLLKKSIFLADRLKPFPSCLLNIVIKGFLIFLIVTIGFENRFSTCKMDDKRFFNMLHSIRIPSGIK